MKPSLIKAVRRLLDELDDLVNESSGVVGLHLNGDLAPWGELLPGGHFERLTSLDDVRAALPTLKPKPKFRRGHHGRQAGVCRKGTKYEVTLGRQYLGRFSTYNEALQVRLAAESRHALLS